MLKYFFIIVLPILLTFTSQAQTRYKDFVFTDVTIDKDLSYNLSAPAEDTKDYLFDLYQPKGDVAENRPLIIWMHGGGFKYGSKDAEGIKLWSTTFAQRGYVCAGLNYSLSKKNTLFHFDILQQSCYYAVQDAKLAVEYFRKNAKRFHIDPDKIILAGNSAGGMIALQAAYSTNAELAITTGIPDSVKSVKSPGRAGVAAVINYWGGIFDINWLKNAKIPIVSVYGAKDKIMIPTHRDASLYGSIAIRSGAEQLHIPNTIKVFDGYGHELERHFNPLFSAGSGTQKRWLEAGQFTADFLYTQVIK